MSNNSRVTKDKEGAADRFSQILGMLLAGSVISIQQIRLLVETAQQLTKETIESVMTNQFRMAYELKEEKKRVS